MRTTQVETSTYVPQWVVRRAAQEVEPPESYTWERLSAVVMVVDVSGFTALGERLAHQGPDGAELLWRVVNRFFHGALELIHAHGGELLRFAGDAPIALWPAEGKLTETCLRAAACGRALQDALDHYDTGEQAVIRFRVALAAGEVVAARVGGVDGQWEPLVGGPPFDELAVASAHAKVGEVVVGRSVWSQIGAHARGEVLPSGCVRLAGLPQVAAPEPLAEPALSDSARSALRRYIPPAVLARLDAGHRSWLGELRRVTTVFIAIEGLDYRRDDIAHKLDAVLRAIQHVVHRYQGAVNQFMVDDKGTILLAAWGLPGSTHEIDASLAVKASLAIQHALEKLDSACSIGISTGRIFCGIKGNLRRSEYGLLGARVNLAARLMQQARGEILCDESTHSESAAQVSYAAPISVRVKGHEGPVLAYRPRHPAEARHGHASAMVARGRERGLIADSLERLVQGQGSALFIEGEAGIGKTRLLEYVEQECAYRGIKCLFSGANAIESQTPYHAVQPLFAELVGMDPRLDAEERVYTALAWFEQHPHLREIAPLFNPVLSLALPNNATTRAMGDEARAETAIAAYLDVLSQVQPLVLLLDDFHWTDSASVALLRRAVRDLPHALLVFAARLSSEEWQSSNEVLKAEPGVVSLSLEQLDKADIGQLVSARLGAERLDPQVLDLIWNRVGGGYPFYSEELASALLDQGAVMVADGVAHLSGAGADQLAITLPSTLRGVIATRLDRLSPVEQLSLKTASVIGRRFPLPMVRDIYPVPDERDQVQPALDMACQRNLTLLDGELPNRAYLFKHFITQEVAYDHLLFEQRQSLHRAAAAWYATRKGGDAPAAYPLIAYHRERAGEREKAVDALELAGQHALSTFANREAASFVQRALTLDATGDPSPAARRSRWYRILGEAYSRLGKTAQSVQHLSRALTLMGYRLPATRLWVALDLVRQFGRQVFRRIVPPQVMRPADSTLLDAVNTFAELGLMAWYHRDAGRMVLHTVTALNLAEGGGPSPELARLKAAFAVILASIPLHGWAERCAREGIALAAQFEHSLSTSRAHQYAGAYLVGMGRLPEALTQAEAAMAASVAISHERGIEEALNLEIYCAMARADYDTVEARALQQAESGRRRADDQIGFWAQTHRAELRFRQGRNAEASDLLLALDPACVTDETMVKRYWGLRVHLLLSAGAIDGADALMRQHLLPQTRATTFVEHLAYTAVLATHLARWQASGPRAGLRRELLRANRQLRTLAKIFPQATSIALVYAGQVAAVFGQRDRAHSLLTRCIERAGARGDLYEEMLAHEALSDLLSGPDADAERARADTLRASLSPESPS